ncbi:hypothetical protein LMH87_006139 [Akanthomyces muscarius]|uniref:Uncharacterized protein n=1 Tax=Akanthomyces muscarius TaxID=2231603 RepID=A0A9W8QNZ4_AKAMU|nr:hypothetical protein LMH87_006139 [Akanthomyces muscarius]KAJ4164465.1 hypothetical protein LMH87_006139 [Akanthomyces muscarius]
MDDYYPEEVVHQNQDLLVLACGAALIFTAHFRFCVEGRQDRPHASELDRWFTFMMWLLALFISIMLGPAFSLAIIILVVTLIV